VDVDLLLRRRRSGFVVPPPVQGRTGIVTATGKTVCDDGGAFNPLGLTMFWALYGYQFERDRFLALLDWLQPKPIDYFRWLCEVDWKTRTIDPAYSCTEACLGEALDEAYKRGKRVQLTLVGGRDGDAQALRIAQMITPIVQKRPHTVAAFEICNEWQRLNKMTLPRLVATAAYLRKEFPAHVIGLSQFVPDALAEHASPSDAWEKAMRQSGANLFILHTRRSKHDNYWSHVRQGYDFKNSDFPGSNNEPQGPQSSVYTLDNPLQLAMARINSTICGAPYYVLHVGQGVTGIAEPTYGRPENMQDVPNIDAIIDAVAAPGRILPGDVSSWKVQNNSWPDHPLPLPKSLGQGFWEGTSNGSVNKNYASLKWPEFVVALNGVHVNAGGHDGQLVHVGTAKRRCMVTAYNPVTAEVVHTQELADGSPLALPGRLDTMAGYVVRGHFL
jgi:hypothetical protein